MMNDASVQQLLAWNERRTILFDIIVMTSLFLSGHSGHAGSL